MEARKGGIAARVSRKQKAAHDRAVARRQDVAGKPSLITRAKRMIAASRIRRDQQRHDRVVRHATKKQRQAAQAV